MLNRDPKTSEKSFHEIFNSIQGGPTRMTIQGGGGGGTPMLPIRTIYQQNFKADYSGIKIKCGLHILRPRLEKKIVKMLKIGRVIAIFVGLTKILRIF